MTTPGEDLRGLLDPLAALLRARPRWRHVPEGQFTPEPTQTDPAPEPVPIPARTEVYTDPADLPDVLTVDDTVDLGGQISLVQSALAWLWGELQLRVVTGSVTVTGGPNAPQPWAAGTTMDVPVTWDQAPLRTPTGVVVQIEAGILAAGKTTAVVIPESITDLGATVRLTNVSGGPVVVTAQQTITYTAQALYLWVPPYEPETP